MLEIDIFLFRAGETLENDAHKGIFSRVDIEPRNNLLLQIRGLPFLRFFQALMFWGCTTLAIYPWTPTESCFQIHKFLLSMFTSLGQSEHFFPKICAFKFRNALFSVILCCLKKPSNKNHRVKPSPYKSTKETPTNPRLPPTIHHIFLHLRVQ